MERLKPLDEITQPDKRNKNVLWTDDHGNYAPMELRFLHRDAENIKLNDHVPDIVKEHFSQTINLFVYSWFNYQFHVTASFMSLVSLEFALKIKLESEHGCLRKLLKEAKKKGLIQLEDSLIINMANLRNEYSHGSAMLHNISIHHIELCARLINELFKNENSQ